MNKKSIKWVAGIVLPFMLLAGCGANNAAPAGQKDGEAAAPGQTEAAPITLKMGLQPWVGNGPMWIAEKKGFFEKNGLKVELVSFEQDSDMNAAFAADKIQVANLATQTAIRVVGNESMDAKGIIFMDESLDADAILATKDITSVDQLVGKKIAYEEGTTSDLLLQSALKEQGKTVKDVTPVFMPAANAGLSLIPGNVDAAVTYAPYISEVLDKGKDRGIHVLYSAKNSPGLISDMVVTKAAFLTEHPDAKEKLRKAWDEALAFWRENPEEGNQIVAAGSGSQADEMPPILEGLKFFNTTEQAELVNSGEMMKTASNIHQLLKDGGTLKQDVNLEALFDMK